MTLEHRANEGVVSDLRRRIVVLAQLPPGGRLPRAAADEGSGLSLPADLLVETIDRVARAASRDETRPVLTGVLLRLAPEGLTMVATDSYRLAVRQTPARGAPGRRPRGHRPGPRARPRSPAWPARRRPTPWRWCSPRAQALFRVGDFRLTSRLIEGQFPDHRQLVPDAFEHDVAFDRGELLGVLTRIGVLAQRNTPVRLAFEPGTVTVSAISDQVGEGRESLPVAFSGEPAGDRLQRRVPARRGGEHRRRRGAARPDQPAAARPAARSGG